jgi:hypothetical protein
MQKSKNLKDTGGILAPDPQTLEDHWICGLLIMKDSTAQAFNSATV